MEPVDLVGGNPVVELACSDRRPYRRGHGESRLQRRRVVGNAENGGGHRLVAAAWLRAGATLVADIGLAPNAKHTLCRGPEVSRAAALFGGSLSIGHGANDAQKTMGIIASLLFAKGLLGSSFYVPFWVVLSCQLAMALGTLVGGWRIVKTMGSRITRLRPVQGFCAETAGAMTLYLATSFGVPVSTTHTITGAIMGVGAARRVSAVRWGIAGSIIIAWVVTLPAAAAIGALFLFMCGLAIRRQLTTCWPVLIEPGTEGAPCHRSCTSRAKRPGGWFNRDQSVLTYLVLFSECRTYSVKSLAVCGRRDRLEDGREICFLCTYRGMPLGFGKVCVNAAINLISNVDFI